MWQTVPVVSTLNYCEAKVTGYDISKITNTKIAILGSLIGRVGKAFRFGSQPGPQSCDVLRAFSSLTMDALLIVSPRASNAALNFLFSLPLFMLPLMPGLLPFLPSRQWIFIHCGPLQFPLKSTSALPLTSVGTRSGLSYSSLSSLTHSCRLSILMLLLCFFSNSLSNIINFIFFLIFLWPLYAL